MLLITTGGTIAGQVAKVKQDDAMIRTADAFSDEVKPTIDYLNNRHNKDITVVTHELVDIDSSDIAPEHWKSLVDIICDNYDSYDSFVITHGTNTLGYTSAALSFAIANPSKPIILTGSQVPAGLPGSDAMTNLNNAMRVAVWDRPKNPLIGVLVVFGSHIITGTRAKKDTEFDYDAFTSFTVGSIGRIGRIIDINEANLEKHLSYLSTSLFPEADTAKDLVIFNDFDTRIASLTEYPGMSEKIFDTLVKSGEIKGLIIRTFGAGDVSTRLHPTLEKLKRLKIPVVVTTQAPNGNSNFEVNEPGQMLKKQNLAIPAHDMSIESQHTKLAWLLAQMEKGDITYEQFGAKMIDDIRGEINVNFENRIRG